MAVLVSDVTLQLKVQNKRDMINTLATVTTDGGGEKLVNEWQ